MGAFLSWEDPSPTTIWFDLCLEEQHLLKNTVTEHPVEMGADITDHIRQENPRVTLQVFVSNDPIVSKAEVLSVIGAERGGKLVGAQAGNVQGHSLDVKDYDPPLLPTPGSLTTALFNAIGNLLTGKKQYKAQTLTFDSEFDNVQETFRALTKAMEESQILDVVTSAHTYTSMTIDAVTMPRNAEVGTGATITIELTRVRFVSTLKTTAPKPAEASGFPRKNNGAKGAEVDDPTKRKSALVKMGAAAGVF